MNRRALTINRNPSSRRRPSRPCCGHSNPDTSLRCILDPGHRNDHFADGQSWARDEAAA